MLWVSDYLYGPWKSDYESPLVIEGNFPQGTEIIVNVRQVSTESTLQIKADSLIILSKKFICGPDTGADFSQVINTQWGYQNISNKNFSSVTTAAASRLMFENSSGDWMTINSITLKWDDNELIFYLSDDTWGKKQASYRLEADGSLTASDGSNLLPFEAYRNSFAIAKRDSIPLMVQEFGVYNKTPHDVTIAFLSDLLRLFNENQIGWALWNFSGTFGILNSDRSDCQYEIYQGYKLDRVMLETLTQFNNTQTISQEKTISLAPFPLPAKGLICLPSKDLSGKIFIEIRDISGRQLKTFSMSADGSEMIRLDVSDIIPGIHLLSVINNGSRYAGKIIIQE